MSVTSIHPARSMSTATTSIHIFPCTDYFRHVRHRPDRAAIRHEWILWAINRPDTEQRQGDGRIRRWVYISDVRRYLRVILLADGVTVHNAFFDRGFRP